MKEFLNDISSPSWWIGVVIVGIIIHIASAYLKPFIDGRIALFSSKKKKKIQEKNEKRIRTKQELKNNSFKQTMFILVELRTRNTIIISFLLCLLSFSLPSFFKESLLETSSKDDIVKLESYFKYFRIFCYLLSALTLFMGVRAYDNVLENKKIINEVLEEEKNNQV